MVCLQDSRSPVQFWLGKKLCFTYANVIQVSLWFFLNDGRRRMSYFFFYKKFFRQKKNEMKWDHTKNTLYSIELIWVHRQTGSPAIEWSTTSTAPRQKNKLQHCLLFIGAGSMVCAPSRTWVVFYKGIGFENSDKEACEASSTPLDILLIFSSYLSIHFRFLFKKHYNDTHIQ